MIQRKQTNFVHGKPIRPALKLNILMYVLVSENIAHIFLGTTLMKWKNLLTTHVVNFEICYIVKPVLMEIVFLKIINTNFLHFQFEIEENSQKHGHSLSASK